MKNPEDPNRAKGADRAEDAAAAKGPEGATGADSANRANEAGGAERASRADEAGGANRASGANVTNRADGAGQVGQAIGAGQAATAVTAAGQPPARYVIITGLSGSGKSTALGALEDLGYYAVDNLPADLLPAFVDLPLRYAGGGFRAALVMDMRDPNLLGALPHSLENLTQGGHPIEIMFLEASEESLVRRYSQTRRQHPMAQGNEPITDVIRREKKALAWLRGQAHQILDTSRFTVHDLRKEVSRLYSGAASPARMQVNLMSFGFKYGIPPEADLVMDVRFLLNPYFVDELHALDGRDRPVVDYVCSQEDTGTFFSKFKDLLDFLLPRYHQEGKSRLTVAIGCTGGRHRSVVTTEWLAEQYKDSDFRITVRHRDIEQDVKSI